MYVWVYVRVSVLVCTGTCVCASCEGQQSASAVILHVFLMYLELDTRSALVGQGAPKIYPSPFPSAEIRSTMPHTQPFKTDSGG